MWISMRVDVSGEINRMLRGYALHTIQLQFNYQIEGSLLLQWRNSFIWNVEVDLKLRNKVGNNYS